MKQDVFSAVFVPAYSRVSASFLSFSVTSFVTLLRSTWVYPVLTSKIFALHLGQNGKGTHFRNPTWPAHPSRPRTTLHFCRIVSPTQKISVFHHKKQPLSPESHLLSSTVTLTTIPLLWRQWTRNKMPQSTWSGNHTNCYCIRNQLRTTTCFWLKFKQPSWLKIHYHYPTQSNHVWTSKALPLTFLSTKYKPSWQPIELRVVKITQITKT